MTDTDRLRAAAAWCDRWAEDCPDMPARDRATAALLRAVADGHNEACFTPEGECPEGAAALALADAILPPDPPDEDFSRGGEPIPDLVERLRGKRISEAIDALDGMAESDG